jgi:hypothetical protein
MLPTTVILVVVVVVVTITTVSHYVARAVLYVPFFSLCLLTALGYYHVPNPKMISSLANHQRFPFDVYFFVYGVRYAVDLMLVHFFADRLIGRCCFCLLSLPPPHFRIMKPKNATDMSRHRVLTVARILVLMYLVIHEEHITPFVLHLQRYIE